MLPKLGNIRIRSNLFMSIKNFLVRCQQRVQVNSKLYSWKAVLSGVPQGTVWEPVFFLLYLNNLPSLLSSSILLCADDVKIWKEITCEGDSLVL